MSHDMSMATMNRFREEFRGADAARSVLQTVLDRYGPREFTVELWDGEHWPARSRPASPTLN